MLFNVITWSSIFPARTNTSQGCQYEYWTSPWVSQNWKARGRKRANLRQISPYFEEVLTSSIVSMPNLVRLTSSQISQVDMTVYERHSISNEYSSFPHLSTTKYSLN